MQRSSLSIASLAAALAKAQAELVNPEKTKVATIRPEGAASAERSFRYAPLSSGLDIVRKALGQHEIATIQTTAVDQSAGIVSLTTTLAHSSGEWVASDWPVCPVTETANPQRMGAALTYARRYALFTLVGIAGEDDLDAPDLNVPTQPATPPEGPSGGGDDRLNGTRRYSAPPRPYGRRRSGFSPPADSILRPEASAALRQQLLAELADVASGEEAASWAQRVIGSKNNLTAADAARVEAAFAARLARLPSQVADASPVTETPLWVEAEPVPRSEPPMVRPIARRRRSKAKTAGAIDKSALAFPEPRRVRDREHVKLVAKQFCLVCGRQPCDTHHLRFTQSRALGRKVSDEFTVPLCRGHHREVHRCGDEAAWWRQVGIDPTKAARALWLETHPLPAIAATVVEEDATSVAAVSTYQSNARSDRIPAKLEPDNETKPIEKAATP